MCRSLKRKRTPIFEDSMNSSNTMFFKKLTFESTIISVFNSAFAKARCKHALILITALYSQIIMSQNLPDAITLEIPEELSKAYLDSCPENTILFTNDTGLITSLNFLQQVYNYRKDVELVDLKMLELPGYYRKYLGIHDENQALNLPKEITRPAGQLKFPINLNEKRITNLNALENHFNNDSLYIKREGTVVKYFPGRDIGILESEFSYRFKELDDRNDVVRDHVITRWKKDQLSRGELFALLLISKNSNNQPIAFANTGRTGEYLGFESYLIQYGLIEILQPVLKVRTDKTQDSKIILTSKLWDELLPILEENYQNQRAIPRKWANDILRPVLYKEAKHLLEIEDSTGALSLLNKSIHLLSPEVYGVDETVYNMGMLYFDLGKQEIAVKLTEMYVVERLAALESKFVTTSFARRIAINNSARELKRLRDFVNLHVTRFPDRKEYWMSKLEKIRSRRKTWSQNIDLD